jgi:hypothetical protein
MWLRDYLPADISGIRVMIYGYSSKLEESTSHARLIDYTIPFLQILQGARHSQRVSKKNQDLASNKIKYAHRTENDP